MVEQRRAAAAAQQRVIGDFVGRAAIGAERKGRVGDAVAVQPDSARCQQPDGEASFALFALDAIVEHFGGSIADQQDSVLGPENAIADDSPADGPQTALGAQTGNEYADGWRRADFFRQRPRAVALNP